MPMEVRIKSVRLHNFKSVSHGKIDFNNYYPSGSIENGVDLYGVYGPNGSGKTAIIDACSMIRHLFVHGFLPEQASGFIKHNHSSSAVEIEFFVRVGEDQFLLLYAIEFSSEGFFQKPVIKHEYLKYKYWDKDRQKFSPMQTLECFKRSDSGETDMIKSLFTAQHRRQIEGVVKSDPQKSWLFNSLSKSLLKEIKDYPKSPGRSHRIKLLQVAIANLVQYAENQWLIINNESYGEIPVLNILPMHLHHQGEEFGIHGSFPVDCSLSTPSIPPLPKQFEPVIQESIAQINVVLSQIIAGLTIELAPVSSAFGPNGEELISFETFAVRGENRIPLMYESFGIKRIISILSALIAAVNNPYICLMIDEMDSGVFEYLLGEIINVLSETAKGQILFTAHNLHPLEEMHYRNIYFTTTLDDESFVHLKNVKTTNNLRDLYLRTLVLSADSEQYLKSFKEGKIRHAFRKAGRMNGKT
ncbi:MAG: AAA family ATPase [Erysipelotrichaceae bacterium]|nr:AAA family ATPase [Erysipelotrichaceae bacterium]